MPDREHSTDTSELLRALDARYTPLAAEGGSLSCGRALDVAAPRAGETSSTSAAAGAATWLRAAERVGPGGSRHRRRRRTSACWRPPPRPLAGRPQRTGGEERPRRGAAARPLRRRGGLELRHQPRPRQGGGLPGGPPAAPPRAGASRSPTWCRRSRSRSRCGNDPAAWAACYGGSIPEADYLAAIAAAGSRTCDVVRRTDPYEKGGVRVRSITVTGRRRGHRRLHEAVPPRHPRPGPGARPGAARPAAHRPGRPARAARGARALRGARRPAAPSRRRSRRTRSARRASWWIPTRRTGPSSPRPAPSGRARRRKTPTQLVVVPSFGCNLACTYCYQELFDPAAAGLIAPEPRSTPSSPTWTATTRARRRARTSRSSAASRSATRPAHHDRIRPLPRRRPGARHGGGGGDERPRPRGASCPRSPPGR